MARWQVVPVTMRSIQDEERENLMGISTEVHIIVKQATIDLDRVESYARLINEDGEDDENQTDIWMVSGGNMLLQLPFKTFDALIRKTK